MSKNPFIIFSPFLLFYIIFIVLFNPGNLSGDEIRYFYYAGNLLHGFYSPPIPKINLVNGPGYPFIVAPFLSLDIPVIVLRLLNAVFQYLSIALIFKVLIKFVTFRLAVIVCLFWGCYYNALDFIAYAAPESFSIFLISLLVFTLLKAFNAGRTIKRNPYIWTAGLIFGYLILTKLIFGYVLLCMLAGCLLLWLTNLSSVNYKKGVVILSIAFITVLPYLFYTYHLTGKVLYWGSSGGINLYCMTTLHEGEYGSWFPEPRQLNPGRNAGNANNENDLNGLIKKRANYYPGYEDSIFVHNQKDWDEIKKFEGMERDEAFQKAAINNIRSHPVKFLKNCFSNIGRILFNYPYSYEIQRPATLLRLPLNGTIAVLMLFCIIPTFYNWKKIDFSVRFLLFLVLIYLGGSIIGSAETRMFTPVVPVLLIWIAIIVQKSLKINFGKWSS
jgi:hypothetical protein